MPGIRQHILNAQHHTGQQSGRASGQLGVYRIGLSQGFIGPHFQEGVEGRVLALDVAQIILHELTAGRGARRQLATNFG